MKFLTTLLLMLALGAQAQITNGVKVSALPTASALGGTELVPIVQGGVTKQATPNQFSALVTPSVTAVQTYATSTSNSLAIAGLNLTNLVTAASNFLAAYSLAVTNADAAARLALSNSTVQWVGNLTNMVNQSSNSLVSAFNAALVATNASLQSTISAIQTQAGTGIQNSGNGVLNTLTVTNVVMPSTNIGSITVNSVGQSQTLSLTSGSFQRASLTFNNSAYSILPTFVGMQDGQNVNFLFVASGVSGHINLPTGTTGSYTIRGGGGTLNIQANGAAVVQCAVIGNSIILSGSAAN